MACAWVVLELYAAAAVSDDWRVVGFVNVGGRGVGAACVDWVLIGAVGLLVRGMVDAVLVGLHWFIASLHASTSADGGDRSAKASEGLVGV